MSNIISKERAYEIAGGWGSLISAGDPGACFYAFHFQDGRPVSETHRAQCLTYARSILRDHGQSMPPREEDDLYSLIRFLNRAPLYS